MKNYSHGVFSCFGTLVVSGVFILFAQTAYAAATSQTITLEPGWNLVSTPRVVASQLFSTSSDKFSIFVLDASKPGGWTTMSEIGQTKFTPLYGYFIKNHSSSTQTLTLTYAEGLEPNEKLFSRSFATPGWYSIGVANTRYAKRQAGDTTDTNNPSVILADLLSGNSAFSQVGYFTTGNTPSPILRTQPNNASDVTEINTLPDFRDTVGYVIYIKQAGANYSGYQGDYTVCNDGVDNDGDLLVDYPSDQGCSNLTSTDENQSTVASGNLVLSKYTAYANQMVTVPQTAYKIGEFRITTGSTEGVNLSTFTLDFGSSTASVTNLQDVYIQYGSKNTVVKSTVSASGNTYSINEPVAANSTMEVRVYATLNASITAGQTVVPSLAVSGTSQNAGNNVTVGLVLGQTITAGTGTFTASLDASTPVSALVVGGSQPKVASFRFTASNDAFTITELWFNATGSAAISELILKDGNTEVKRQPFNGTDLKMTGLNIPVAYNTNKVLDVYAVVAAIGTGNAAAGQDVGVSLYAMKHRNSNGVETTVPGLSLSSNSMYAYKTKPTISLVPLPTTVLAPGTQTIAKFTITSDAGGPISWRKLVMSYATATPSGTFTLSNFNIYGIYGDSNPGVTVTVGTGSNTTVTFTSSSTDQQVSGTKTYVVKADIGGTGIVTGASLQTWFTNSGETFTAPTNAGNLIASTASFVWSDESVIPHSDTSADWNNGFLVKNLPTDSQTMTK